MAYYLSNTRTNFYQSHEQYRLLNSDDKKRLVNEPQFFAGSFSTKDSRNSNYLLFELGGWDADFISKQGLKLKENEVVFRYETQRTQVAGISPFVKVNIKSGRVYFNVGDTDIEEVIFSTQGTVTTYLNISDRYL